MGKYFAHADFVYHSQDQHGQHAHPTFLIRSANPFVIPTEAEPSGGIWLRTKSKYSQNPDVSTQFTLSKAERARHDILEL